MYNWLLRVVASHGIPPCCVSHVSHSTLGRSHGSCGIGAASDTGAVMASTRIDACKPGLVRIDHSLQACVWCVRPTQLVQISEHWRPRLLKGAAQCHHRGHMHPQGQAGVDVCRASQALEHDVPAHSKTADQCAAR